MLCQGINPVGRPGAPHDSSERIAVADEPWKSILEFPIDSTLYIDIHGCIYIVFQSTAQGVKSSTEGLRGQKSHVDNAIYCTTRLCATEQFNGLGALSEDIERWVGL